MTRRWLAILALIGLAACPVAQRFPDDVQSALAHDEMRRIETEHFLVYYPAHRRAEIDRFLVRAERCAGALRDAARIKNWSWQRKMVIAMPETALDNAFAYGGEGGYEPAALIPTISTLDFATEFGLLPDPGVTACHELVHYVHLEQIAGFWGALDHVFGDLFTPQFGADSWFLEGLATHYEAKFSPGVGRPVWPIFTGMFAAAYAGDHITGGDLSIFKRLAPVGHQYLVGAMFLRYLTERYGEPPLWTAIESQGKQITSLFFAGTFKDGFGKSLGDLIDEFDAWHARTFPARPRPPGQRALATLGNDARYARGRDGTEAWVADDVDQPPRLVVRDPAGRELAEISLVDVVPPRTVIDASPLLVSGLSITADGREVWLTIVDRSTTEHVPRLLRWRRGESGLTELSDELGPCATVDPTGATYYYCAVDGDRWSLGAWDVRRGARRILVDARPGTYVLGAQVSPDGARLIANAWDGTAFVAWIIDAATGARLGELRGAGTPIYDASFTDDGRAMYLGVVDARFQVVIDGRPVTDAPYAALAPRTAGGTIRFLNREGWNWTLDEVAVPGPGAAPAPPPPDAPPVTGAAQATPAPAPPSLAPAVASDQAYSAWEHFFYPQIRSPFTVTVSSKTTDIGAFVGGGDRLGLQRWSLTGHLQPMTSYNDRTRGGGDIAYLNTMAAPWRVALAAGYADWVDPVEQMDSDVTLAEHRRTWDAAALVTRTWRDTLTTTLAGVYTEDQDQPPAQRALDRKLGGPAVTLDWVSAETTRYTGLRRALIASASGAYYPASLSSFAGDIYDLRGELGGVVPLPLGARHTIALHLIGRTMVAHGDTGLLQVGGLTRGAQLVAGRSVAADPPAFDEARFPPNLRFIEYLRGYEDYAITTDRIAIGSVSWRYPIIIDRGFAATFGVLPSSFLRQIDLELFATGALDRAGDRHAAAGGELTLHVEFGPLVVQLGYQVARRLRDDLALTQLLVLVGGL